MGPDGTEKAERLGPQHAMGMHSHFSWPGPSFHQTSLGWVAPGFLSQPVRAETRDEERGDREAEEDRTRRQRWVMGAEEGTREKAREGCRAEALGVEQGCPVSWPRGRELHRSGPCTLPRKSIVIFWGRPLPLAPQGSSEGVSEAATHDGAVCPGWGPLVRPTVLGWHPQPCQAP